MRWLSIFLALGLLFAPSLAWSLPDSPSQGQSSSVVLSQAEAAQIQVAMEQAQEALKKSNEEIANQSKLLTKLWLFSGALAAGVIIEAVANIIHAIKE